MDTRSETETNIVSQLYTKDWGYTHIQLHLKFDIGSVKMVTRESQC